MTGRLMMRPPVLQLIPYILLMLCTMNNIKVIVNLKRDYLVDGEADPNGPLKSKGWHKSLKDNLRFLIYFNLGKMISLKRSSSTL